MTRFGWCMTRHHEGCYQELPTGQQCSCPCHNDYDDDIETEERDDDAQ